jgi:hypothetical protein
VSASIQHRVDVAEEEEEVADHQHKCLGQVDKFLHHINLDKFYVTKKLTWHMPGQYFLYRFMLCIKAFKRVGLSRQLTILKNSAINLVKLTMLELLEPPN